MPPTSPNLIQSPNPIQIANDNSPSKSILGALQKELWLLRQEQQRDRLAADERFSELQAVHKAVRLITAFDFIWIIYV
jgi:hypothetical protein